MGAASQLVAGLARRLLQDQLIKEDQLQEALAAAKRDQEPLAFYLAKANLIDADQIAYCAATEFGSPLIDLASFNSQLIEREALPLKLVQKHRAVPLIARGNQLFLAMADPSDLRALDEFKFNSGLNTEAIVVNALHLTELIKSFTDEEDALSGEMDEFDEAGLENLDVAAVDDEPQQETNEADETPVVKFINKVLLDAIRNGASDIHFEPYEKSYRVRFRTDGILQEKVKPPTSISGRLAARLKVMSQMDISERRVPQDGRIKMRLSKTKSIDFRVNTLPTLWGEKIVLRILDASSAQMGIDALGYEEIQKSLYLEALHYPQGMILVTGPTGSGKTVSLYTGLNILNTPERNISTAEDPVEINLEGINQVNVNNKVGLTFSEALKSFLRQDPDIIMVGEIRDLETGNIAIKAAQTGHMVMSTLHTNSAAETITRMLNMGVPAFNLATSVSLIIAQRLARRLCAHCKTRVEYPKEAMLAEGFSEAEIADMDLQKAVGCTKCSKGYKGRVGIYEVVKMTPELQKIVMEGGNSIEISTKAREQGFNDLRRSGLLKALSGVTSLEEINRVTKD